MLNLISNAVDACVHDADRRIDVCSECINGKTIRIEVSDNGCGISKEHQAKLFQTFFSTKGSKGTGLGLAVTHKIITEMKGKITVDSALGEGTTFIVTLPKKEAESE